MALAYAQYQGNGSTGPYNITFPFISKAHVQVKVDGNLVAFTWLTNTTIRLTAPAPVSSIIDIRRVTPRDTLLVNFVDGSTLVESDLDLSALQVFYLSQEAFDLGEASLGVTEDGSFSALNRRISNVLDPVNATDVATKRFVETGVTSQVVIATQKANESAASAGASAGSATASAGSASASAGSASTANSHRAAAAVSETNAAASEAAVLAYKNAAAGSASAASGSASAADASRIASANSAAAAAKSAQDAAIFDPSSYWTKTQSDSRYLASTALTPYYNKTEVDAKVAGVNLSSRVAKTGDIMTGSLEIQGDPSLWLHRGNVKRAKWEMGTDGHLRFIDQGGTVHFMLQNNGAIWCQEFGYLNQRIEDRAVAHADDRGYWRTRDYMLAELIPVGGYVFGRASGASVGPGNNYSGGSITYASGAADNQQNRQAINYGTFTACGRADAGTAWGGEATLFKRIG